LGVAFGGTLACTAILAPRDDVERCGTADDCTATGDNRYISECRFDPESDLDATEVDRICVAAYKQISCAVPENTVNGYTMAWDELVENDIERYTACSMTFGARGCPPDQTTGQCMGELQRDSRGICDDTDPATPPAFGVTPVHGISTEVIFGQDVKDQFCRSFFCDASFVCDTDDDTCVPCDPEAEFGRGGCGQVYVAGAPSCAYLDQAGLDNACQAPESDASMPSFGMCM
jgi:hypothetical protein